jgi:ribosome-binding protein aMBF1 (putative translation factor)
MKQIQLKREANTWSRRELAFKAKLSERAVWRIEERECGTQPKTRRGLAKALGVEVSELFDENGRAM